MTVDGRQLRSVDDALVAIARALRLPAVDDVPALAAAIERGGAAVDEGRLLVFSHGDQLASIPVADSSLFVELERLLAALSSRRPAIEHVFLDLPADALAPVLPRLLETQPPARLRFGAARGRTVDGAPLVVPLAATLRLAGAPAHEVELAHARARCIDWLCNDLAYRAEVAEADDVAPSIDAAFAAIEARRAWINEDGAGQWEPLTSLTFDRVVVVDGGAGLVAMVVGEDEG